MYVNGCPELVLNIRLDHFSLSMSYQSVKLACYVTGYYNISVKKSEYLSQNCDVAIILKIDTNFHLSSSKSHVSPGDIGCLDIQSVPFWDLLSYTVMYGYKMDQNPKL